VWETASVRGAAPALFAARGRGEALVLLLRRLRGRGGGAPPPSLQVVGPGEPPIDLPEDVVRAMRDATEYLAKRESVTVVPTERLLTTQQAADLLNLSRPYRIGLLGAGDVPSTATRGGHRRIRLDDLLHYKAQRDARRKAALGQLTRPTEELGLYKGQ